MSDPPCASLAELAAAAGAVAELTLTWQRWRLWLDFHAQAAARLVQPGDSVRGADPLRRALAPLRFPLVHRLTLKAPVDVPLANAVLDACPALHTLHFRGCYIVPAAASALLAAPGLEEAHISGPTLCDAAHFQQETNWIRATTAVDSAARRCTR